MKRLLSNRMLGGVLLVAGTTIGAGMLALPVSTVFGGFYPALATFFLIWLIMLASSFLFLEVNLAMPAGSNMITMAEKTLGVYGKTVAWFIYLLLLYSLTAAYISGSASLFHHAFTQIGIESYLPKQLLPTVLPIVFAAFIYLGAQGVDYVNRIFMLFLIICYFALIGYGPSDIEVDLLKHVDWKATMVSYSVIVTSFGYHIIIPTLSTYLNHNKKRLKWTLFLGSLIPLVVFILWNGLVLGAVSLPLLAEAYQEGSGAVAPLATALKNPKLTLVANFFAFFAITTSFLGVTLSLSDFLTDGFKIPASPKGRLMALLFTFIPPLLFVYSFERGFLLALNYAGVCVAILLVMLPALMVWNLKKKSVYHTFWGKVLLTCVTFFSIIMIVFTLLLQRGLLRPLVQHYMP